MAQANKLAKDARRNKPATDSTLATLETRTSTGAVRAARPAGLNVGANFTGQYLYDRFVTNDQEQAADVTRMEIVAAMIANLDVKQFGTIVGEMVGVAQGYLKNITDTAKKTGTFDDKNPPLPVREAAARLKTARNHQTVMRTAYGAMKFAAEEWKKLTGDAEIGYRLVREVGAKALENAGVNWDGTKADSKEVKDKRAAMREESEALIEVQEANPRKDGEDRAAYFQRVDKLVDKRLKERAAERQAKVVEMLVDKIRKIAGQNLDEVLDALLSAGEPGNAQEVTAEKLVVLAGGTPPAADAALH